MTPSRHGSFTRPHTCTTLSSFARVRDSNTTASRKKSRTIPGLQALRERAVERAASSIALDWPDMS
eukprot:6660376-Lingulodinium_polyedra.AAC.1